MLELVRHWSSRDLEFHKSVRIVFFDTEVQKKVPGIIAVRVHTRRESARSKSVVTKFLQN